MPVHHAYWVVFRLWLHTLAADQKPGCSSFASRVRGLELVSCSRPGARWSTLLKPLQFRVMRIVQVEYLNWSLQHCMEPIYGYISFVSISHLVFSSSFVFGLRKCQQDIRMDWTFCFFLSLSPKTHDTPDYVLLRRLVKALVSCGYIPLICVYFVVHFY